MSVKNYRKTLGCSSACTTVCPHLSWKNILSELVVNYHKAELKLDQNRGFTRANCYQIGQQRENMGGGGSVCREGRGERKNPYYAFWKYRLSTKNHAAYSNHLCESLITLLFLNKLKCHILLHYFFFSSCFYTKTFYTKFIDAFAVY